MSPQKKSPQKKRPRRRVTQSPSLGPHFHRAFRYAAQKHALQKRKLTTIPYISHPMGVATLVLEAGGDEEQAIAALLHDVVEDCGGIPVLREIRRRFGPRVARIVDGCTDSYAYKEPKRCWILRKTEYIEHLKTADRDIRLVSAADKLHNARSILADYRKHGESVWKRFTARRQGTLWYYRALADEFRCREPNPLAADLEIVVAELEALARARAKSAGASSTRNHRGS